MTIKKSSETISKAIYDWLAAEVESSGTSRNMYLDDFESARTGLLDGWDHPNNTPARKTESHLDRLPLWWEAYSFDPLDDYQSAKITFAGLMLVSGNYRAQCYIEAVDGQDYITKRSKVIGIDAQQVVTHRLMDILPKNGSFKNADVSLENLDKERQYVAKFGEAATRAMCMRTRLGYDLGIPDSSSARRMMDTQHEWLRFSVDNIALAAKFREGELEAVPFLEPISITDQSGETHLALDPTFNGWSNVLAD